MSRRCMIAGLSSTMAILLLVFLALTSSAVVPIDAFAPAPSSSRRMSSSRIAPSSTTTFGSPASPQWAKPLDVVDDDNTEGSSLVVEQQVEKEKTYHNPTPVMVKAFENLWQKNTALVAVASLALALVMTPLPSMAAMSGGRMGGSFSAPRSSSSYSGSVSPSRSSYGSGYSRGFSQGFGSGYYSRGPSVMINPITPMVSPFYRPYGGYYGGPGIITYSSGPGILPLLLFGGLAFAALSAMSNSMASTSATWSSDSASSSFLGATSSALGSGTSVVQVSVALEVPNRDDRNSILSVLDRLANTARTDTRVGIQNLTSQVALELLRRKNSIVSASSNYKRYNDREKALRDFNKRSIKERSKFESETVSNYGGVDYASGSSRGGTGTGDGKATMAVVTLLLTIDGDSTKVPQIRSPADVEEALRMIASDSKVDSCLQGAEILWTPEDRAETLSPRDVIADYPELRSI